MVRLCNWVGEAVLSLPALRRLAAAATISTLWKGWAPALLAGAGWPVTVRRGGVKEATGQLRSLRQTLEFAGRPPALLMTNSFASALEMRLAGFAPSGYAREGRSLLLRNAYRLPRFAHAAHAYWHLAGRFLGTDAQFPGSLGWTASGAQREQAQALWPNTESPRGRSWFSLRFQGRMIARIARCGRDSWNWQRLCKARKYR